LPFFEGLGAKNVEKIGIIIAKSIDFVGAYLL
jgi:hypothetical protein